MRPTTYEMPISAPMFRRCARALAMCAIALPGLATTAPAAPVKDAAMQPPLVWIFMGLPGDEARRKRYLETVGILTKALQDHAQIPKADIHVLFGRGDKAAAYPPCTAEALWKALAGLSSADGRQRPVWLFFLGHAATVKDDVYFHVPGPDVSMREVATRLTKVEAAVPLVLVLTTAASGNCLALLRGPHRAMLAASPPGMADSEPECPHVLARILADPRTADTNGDHLLSLAEMAVACRKDVVAWYRDQGLICNERVVVDGNGDGTPGQINEHDDERCAQSIGLRYRP